MLVSHMPQAEVLSASRSNQHEVKETSSVMVELQRAMVYYMMWCQQFKKREGSGKGKWQMNKN